MSPQVMLVSLYKDMKHVLSSIDEIKSDVKGAASVDALEDVKVELTKTSDDHEKRLRTLESFRWHILGGAALAAFCGTMMADVIHLLGK